MRVGGEHVRVPAAQERLRTRPRGLAVRAEQGADIDLQPRARADDRDDYLLAAQQSLLEQVGLTEVARSERERAAR